MPSGPGFVLHFVTQCLVQWFLIFVLPCFSQLGILAMFLLHRRHLLSIFPLSFCLPLAYSSRTRVRR